MSLGSIVLKNVFQRKLSSALTTLSIALGVAVMIAILTIRRQGRESFSQTAFGYELIVGAKGSALQLVLNTVYHLDVSPGNIPYSLYRELKDQDKRVRLALPVAVGDHYQGFRIVGTSDAFLREFEYEPGKRFEIDGAPFRFSEERLEKTLHGEEVEGPFEAVIGSAAAKKTGLVRGSTFAASHGVLDEVNAQTHEERWTVVGVLRETGTPADRAIFINLDSFFEIRGHTKGGQISAVILKTRGGYAAISLQSELNRRPEIMAVVPAQVVGDLFEMVGKVDGFLLAISILVVVVAGVSILVSIYNSMSERRRAIAIMRAIGARRRTVLAVILMEAMFLCLVGGVVGLFLGHLLASVAGLVVASEVGLRLSPWSFHVQELFVLTSLAVLGALVGILPAVKAYRTDIASGLSGV